MQTLMALAETNRQAEALHAASTTANRLAVGDCVWHDKTWWRVAATGERARKATPFPCGDPNIRPVLLERHGVETLQWWQPTRWVVVSR